MKFVIKLKINIYYFYIDLKSIFFFGTALFDKRIFENKKLHLFSKMQFNILIKIRSN